MKNFFKKIYKKAIKYLTEDRSVEQKLKYTNRIKVKVIKVQFEWEDGLIRTLEGEKADNYIKDILKLADGQKPDFAKHIWKESSK